MSKETETLLAQVRSARRVSTPLIALSTPDPGASIEWLCETFVDSPLVEWDVVRGFRARNEAGKASIAEALGSSGGDDPSRYNPVAAMEIASRMHGQVSGDRPRGTVVFVHMADRFLQEPTVIQAIWLLRDAFKSDNRTLIMLSPSFTMPPELSGDVVVFDEPLPDEKSIERIVLECVDSVPDLTISTGQVSRAREALTGLSAFQAEQVTAMSLTRDGIDTDALWERKRRQIELTPGLKVHRDTVSFKDIGGVEIVKGFTTQIMSGKSAPNAVVFIDEIEKMLAGAGGGGSSGSAGDTSGVSQDQLGSLLSYMQDHAASGMIFVGPPGSAKSMVAKAAGNAAGIPTIQLDLGGLKGSLVGQSESNLRNALKVITSVSNGRSLWIATCNAIASLPPELRRRFTLGTFFFDLPTAPERDAIWKLHLKAHDLPANSKRPDDRGWTGAEIRQCCDIAWRLGRSLQEAAAFIVPVSRSAAEQIEQLRRQASGRFLSASRHGTYQQPDEETTSGADGGGTKRRAAIAV